MRFETGMLARAGAFRSAVATALEQMRSALAAAKPGANGRGARVAQELGPFAAGRMDAGAIATLTDEGRALEPAAVATIERAAALLQELLARGDDLFRVQVPSGQRLGAAVYRALADVGRAFGAARVADLARAGRYRADAHAAWLEAYPFRAWSTAERRLAPPLAIDVEGGDLAAESLVEFLDGGVKLVLRVAGATTPAPLVRLISPGVYAQQAHAGDDLARAAAYDGPAVVMLFDGDAAEFVHDPEANPRLAVGRMPEALKGALGGRSRAQQAEELALLLSWAEAGAAGQRAAGSGAEPGAAAAAADPASLLAAWLLSEGTA